MKRPSFLAAAFFSAALSFSQTVDSLLCELYFVRDENSGRDSALFAQSYSVRWEGGGTRRFTCALMEPENDSFVLEAAYVDGDRVSFGSGEGEVGVLGNPVEARFPPISAADGEAHSFAVVYRLLGTVEKGRDADSVTIPVLAANRQWDVASVLVGVGFDSRDVIAGEIAVSARGANVVRSESGFLAKIPGVRAGESAAITIPLRKDSLSETMPEWQVRRDRARSLLPPSIAAAVALALVGAFLAYSMRKSFLARFGHDAGADVPAGDVHPALAAALCSFGLSVTRESALACLLRCARDGDTVIRRRKESMEADFLFERPASQSGNPESFESVLLDSLLPQGGEGESVTGWGGDFGRKSVRYVEAVRTELLRRGWTDKLASRVRRGKIVASLSATLVLAFAAPVAFVSLTPSGNWPLGIPLVGGFVAALSVCSFAFKLAPLSASGHAVRNTCRREAKRMSAALGTPGNITQEEFDRGIEYAAAFGFLSAWAALPELNAALVYPGWLGDMASGEKESAAFALERAGEEAEEDAESDLEGEGDGTP